MTLDCPKIAEMFFTKFTKYPTGLLISHSPTRNYRGRNNWGPANLRILVINWGVGMRNKTKMVEIWPKTARI